MQELVLPTPLASKSILSYPPRQLSRIHIFVTNGGVRSCWNIATISDRFEGGWSDYGGEFSRRCSAFRGGSQGSETSRTDVPRMRGVKSIVVIGRVVSDSGGCREF